MNRCGGFVAYPSTGECRNCYRRRRKAHKPAPVADLPRKDYTFKEHQPMGRGRKKKLLADGRAALLADSHYMIQIAQAANNAKQNREKKK